MTVFQNIRRDLIPASLAVDEVYDLAAASLFAENEDFELIDGEIVPMAAAKADWHEMIKSPFTRGSSFFHPSPSGEGPGVGAIGLTENASSADGPHPNPSPEGEGRRPLPSGRSASARAACADRTCCC